MSSTQEGTTLVLASIAVCLMIYAMNLQYKRGDTSVRIVNAINTVKETLGASRFFKGKFGKGTKAAKKLREELKSKRSVKKALGIKRARVDPNIDCSKVSPSDPNWARCSQGASVGRVPTTSASTRVQSTILDFARESNANQGLGMSATRLTDGFVQDQFDQGLGAGLGGLKISHNLQNNAFFSQGTENPGALVTSGISTEAAAAFPFSRRSDEGAEARQNTPPQTGPVPGTEPVGMGMSFAKFIGKDKMESSGDGSRGASRQMVVIKEEDKVGNPFVQTKEVENPFVQTKELGSGLALSEAFSQKTLGSGLLIEDAFKTQSLGAAVSPVSGELGASPEDIAQATAVLKEVNIVQSTTGGQLDFGIRP